MGDTGQASVVTKETRADPAAAWSPPQLWHTARRAPGLKVASQLSALP